MNSGPEGWEPLNSNDRLFFSYTNFTFSDILYNIFGDVTEDDVCSQWRTLCKLTLKHRISE